MYSKIKALYLIGIRLFLFIKIKGRNNMYSTQMEAAKKGIFTKEMEIVARDENMSKEELMERGQKLKLM